jgi:hypothetical protein
MIKSTGDCPDTETVFVAPPNAHPPFNVGVNAGVSFNDVIPPVKLNNGIKFGVAAALVVNTGFESVTCVAESTDTTCVPG